MQTYNVNLQCTAQKNCIKKQCIFIQYIVALYFDSASLFALNGNMLVAYSAIKPVSLDSGYLLGKVISLIINEFICSKSKYNASDWSTLVSSTTINRIPLSPVTAIDCSRIEL